MVQKFKLTIQNQTPVVLTDNLSDWYHHLLIPADQALSDFDNQRRNWVNKELIEPLFNQPDTQFIDTSDSNNPVILDQDSINQLILDTLNSDDAVQTQIEMINQIINQSLKYSNNSSLLNFNYCLGYQSLLRQKLPLPSTSIKYTFATDLLPLAKDLASQHSWSSQQYQEALATMTGMYLKNGMLSYTNYVLVFDDHIYHDLITTIQNNLKPKMSQLTADDQKMVTQLSSLDHFENDDAFQCLIFPQNYQANSFTRNLWFETIQYLQNNSQQSMLLPLNLRQLFNPSSLTFINVSTLATMSNQDYQMSIRKVINSLNRVNNIQLTRLKKLYSANTVYNDQLTHDKDYTKKSKQLCRLKNISFSNQPLSTQNILDRIVKIAKSQISRQVSDNSFKLQRRSFMRPNRRQPDNMDASGIIQSTAYHPDIHIFLDTSLSITESMYQTNIKLLIALAKKLDTNIYFTSFADTVAQPVKLNVKHRSINQIYQMIKRIPKVTGGTEYENVWKLVDQLAQINQSHGRAYQLNFMITDFAYCIDNNFVLNPNQASTRNMYYIPVNDPNNYQDICNDARDFANSLIDRGDLTIKQRILM